MKYFSYLSGVLTGTILVGCIGLATHLFRPSGTGTTPPGTFQQQNGNRAGNTARMAERLGITEVELQKELDSGKTMQQITQEHGVTFGRRGSGATLSSSSGSSL